MESKTVWIIVISVVSFIIFWFVNALVSAYCTYTITLKRGKKSKWGRAVSSNDEPQLIMDDIGMKWHRENIDFKKDVHIINNGLNLYGEYYDFGFDRCAMILSGRTESLRYGYYFARPYQEAGFNVLVLDPRAHGLSDGDYNTVGFEEGKDALSWAKFIHDEFKLESIILHGICIGSAAGMYAINAEDAPDYIKGIVTEGMFPNFWESMKNHLKEKRVNFFPMMQCLDFWMKKYTGHSMRFGPINVIPKMNRPILMLQSKVDKYSLYEYACKMYEMCPSKEKKLVVYEKGGHSLLRITDTERYDNEIKEFIKRVYEAEALI